MAGMRRTVDRRSSEADVGQKLANAQRERSYRSYYHLLDCYSLLFFHSPWFGVLALAVAQVMEMELVLEEVIPFSALEQAQYVSRL